MCCASNVKVKTVGRAREGGPAGRWREPKAGSRAPARPRCPRAPARGLQGCTRGSGSECGGRSCPAAALASPPHGAEAPSGCSGGDRRWGGPGLPSLFILTGRSMTSTPRCWCPGARLHPAGRRAPVGGPARPRRCSGPAAGARGQGAAEFRVCGGGAHAEPPLETAQGPPCPPGARSAQPADARLPLPGHAHPAPEGVQPPRRHDQQRRHPVLHHGACPRRVAPSGARAVLRPLPGTLALPGPRGPAGPPGLPPAGLSAPLLTPCFGPSSRSAECLGNSRETEHADHLLNPFGL